MKMLSLNLLLLLALGACEWTPEQVAVFENSSYRSLTLAVGDTTEIILLGNTFLEPQISNPEIVEVLSPEVGGYAFIGLAAGQVDIVIEYPVLDQNNESGAAVLYVKLIITNGMPLTVFVGEQLDVDLSSYIDSTALSLLDSVDILVTADPGSERLLVNADSQLKQLAFEGLRPGDLDVVVAYFDREGLLLSSLLFECHIAIRKIVLAELFTNTGCVNCPEANHYMDNILVERAANVALVRYHVSWTDPRDPMNLYNPSEVRDRVIYYGIYTAPALVLEGVQVSTLNETDWIGRIDAAAQVTAPIYISPVDLMASADSLFLSYDLESFGQGLNDLLVWSMVLEDSIFFLGSNGEDVHRQVMRDMTSDPISGILTDLTVHQSLRRPEAFDSGVPMSLIIFIQDPASREILQTRRQEIQ